MCLAQEGMREEGNLGKRTELTYKTLQLEFTPELYWMDGCVELYWMDGCVP